MERHSVPPVSTARVYARAARREGRRAGAAAARHGPEGIVFDTAIAAVPARPDPVRLRPAAARACVLQCRCCRSSIWTIRQRFHSSAVRRTPRTPWRSMSVRCALFTPSADERSSSSACASCTMKSSCRSCACWLRWKRRAVRSRRMRCVPSVTRLDVRIRDLCEQIYHDADGGVQPQQSQAAGRGAVRETRPAAPKKTKTGYSTNVEVLERLREGPPDRAAHPRVPHA